MKEQTEKIFRAIGDVGDDLIERADRPVRKHAQVWVKWAALAACCALVIGAAAFIVPMFHAGSTAPETGASYAGSAGGSGCGCAASVLAEYLLPKLENGEWKRILFVPTGALMSKVSFQEGSSVPGIAQAVVIEREEDV